ncbi:MAG: preprotein translocase subunit YajC [Zymomonas mobilis subsp. pomaceae]|uniref:Sec translocon accessory complex subunit YajC n=1 Tax=Zymomonas mobilis subsp. pomaceae (strain ATCC 29192 / DSM 22645 / JCM 10191 / CCUG 17912 / NBRC 13757 / NCIMB 11200 / NRRL B-4491 / Barker I) TaxID=579138 RepID=F8EU98_ZYMMT|nr:preprotein translocase subunit YajC [Zymomonas mobilis]AEI38119.1 preprotein translocase, YajC subunit [Zymomonas mobilis subsp. pomaceae ATCC 29192]MDX5949486.1 preprotein translocase subunit YajC [Zymomonas mobilis subsp. pomaceae]GEB89227.1 preprotein translocase subunit YajC [Zymomonas mobilis subsp. pomaceae]
MFATPAFAQTAGTSTGLNGLLGQFSGMLPFIIVFLIIYLMLIRPQQKRFKEQRSAIDAVQKGDTVITAGGIVGKVSKVDEREVEVEIAKGVKVSVVKATLQSVQPLTAANSNTVE